MTNLFVGLIVLAIVGAAVAYIMQSRKKGIKCIGCPEGLTCPHSKTGCGGCNSCGGDGQCNGHTNE